MRIKETELYKFDELDTDIQAKVLDSMRDWNVQDSYWHESVIDDAKACGAILGIEAREIYFSGFSSQGDGASFVGSYSYAKGSVMAITEHAPQDAELLRIARELVRMQAPTFFTTSATVTHRGHYYCMDIEPHSEAGTLDYDALTEALRDFARWVYANLEREYTYQTSDEVVRESIIANELEFTKDGERA